MRNSVHKNDIFSNLVCIFSQNFSNFCETFYQNRQNAFYVSRGALLQKHYVDFVKQFSTLGKEMSDLLRKLCSLVNKTAFLSPDEHLEEEFWRKFYFFWFFFGQPANMFWYFLCINRGMVVQTEFHKPRGTYLLGKILWENFLSFPDYECIFLNIHWSLLGMLSKLQFTCSEEHIEKSYHFLRFFQNCFRTLSDNRRHILWKISTALPKLLSACPRNFSIFFAVVCHVLFNFGFERKKS